MSLALQTPDFAIQIVRDGIAGAGDQEIRWPSHGVPHKVKALVHPAGSPDQPDRVDVVHRGRVRVIPDVSWITCYCQDVAHPQQVCPHQIRLQPNHVAIAAGHVRNTLHAGSTLDLVADNDRVDPESSARPIRNVHGVDAVASQKGCSFIDLVHVQTSRYVELDRDEKSVAEARAEAALLHGSWWLVSVLPGFARFDLRNSDVHIRDCRADRSNMLRKRTTVNANNRHAGLNKTSHRRGNVVGRRVVDRIAVNQSRYSDVRLRR